MRPVRCDVFCRVIDNYGDIGVCWRLARRLAEGHGWSVRLWVDAPDVLERLAPGAAAHGVPGIQVLAWTEPAPDCAPGDVIVEAFACDPPAGYAARIGPGQVWLNLEYLSAEPWVESHHGLPSPQGGGRMKFFFFPGFTARTGGLLREPGLLDRRDAFQADAAAISAYLHGIGLPASLAEDIGQGRRELVTVFCYPDAPAEALLAALRASPRPRVLALTGGVLPGLAPAVHGALPIVRLPFLPQADYDPLLWAAGLNAVRGEDSFVRAQWAGRPLLWHIYPQEEAAHLDKLHAWLQACGARPAMRAAHLAWNGAHARPQHALADWLDPAEQAASRAAASAWAGQLARGPELADALAKFSLGRLES